jgi:hypothetical protein
MVLTYTSIANSFKVGIKKLPLALTEDNLFLISLPREDIACSSNATGKQSSISSIWPCTNALTRLHVLNSVPFESFLFVQQQRPQNWLSRIMCNAY